MSDRLALANAIEDAGIERSKAARIASVIFDAIHDNVATKADVQAQDGLLLCCRGDAMMALGDRAQAEADYNRALAWSRERNAKWIELNAALRLARPWQADGRTRDARDLLAPVYGWFTEGFDNPVLRDAKALLEELTGTFDSAVISKCAADPNNR